MHGLNKGYNPPILFLWDSNDFMKVIKGLRKPIIFIYFILLINPAIADSNNTDYDDIASHVFWDELYTYGGWTLYCGYRFERDRKIKQSKSVTIEHIYPTVKMMEQLGCGSRMQCRDSGNKLFARMEADMHNLYPVWHALVIYRNGSQFGDVQGEEWRFEDCDIEWQGGIIEPRPLARGNIARSLLYMHMQYGLQLESNMIKMLGRWNKEDPPSNQEIDRNDIIESIQGMRNPYIDDPTKVELLIRTSQKNK